MSRCERGPQEPSDHAEGATGGASAREAIPVVRSSDLVGERGVLRIEHDGESYTLRITRNNRLILTK